MYSIEREREIAWGRYWLHADVHDSAFLSFETKLLEHGLRPITDPKRHGGDLHGGARPAVRWPMG